MRSVFEPEQKIAGDADAGRGARPADRFGAFESVTDLAVVPRNRGISPIGTPLRHYLLDVRVSGPQGGVYTDAVVIEGFGTIYAYAADSDGDIADWLAMVEVPGGDDASVLTVLGCRITASES